MHTLSENKIKANQVEGDINLTATRKQWQDKFLSEKSKKLLDEDSKGLGGSLYPLSAVIGKEEFNICQDISLGHYTHEKSPLGCAIGNAVIEYIENNNILSHVKELETILYTRTKEMKAKFECIGDVRLIGALLGIELVKNRQTKEKATIEAEKVLYLCLEQGLSFKISQGCVLTLAPPLIISPEELNLAMDKLEYALTQVFRHNI